MPRTPLDHFIEAFKHSFHKFAFVAAAPVDERVSPAGRRYRRYVGKFAFEPPAEVLDADLMAHHDEILAAFRGLSASESNCFARRFTRRYIGKDGKVIRKEKYTCTFDIVPRNLVDFRVANGRLYLYVLGYGQ